MKNPFVKAQAIDLKKEQFIMAALAFAIALLGVLAYIPSAHSDEVIVPPYELKSQKLGH